MTVAELQTTLKAFERQAAKTDINEVRKLYREERGLIYVKTHTIQAYFRQYKRRTSR